ncbi:MAG: hypothetical protein WAK33_13815 [Silvibacterium sp.]
MQRLSPTLVLGSRSGGDLSKLADSENHVQERGPVGPTVILRKWLHYG